MQTSVNQLLLWFAGFHGKDGPMSVTDSLATPKATYPFLRAAEELGYKVRDLNGEDQIGKILFSKKSGFIPELVARLKFRAKTF